MIEFKQWDAYWNNFNNWDEALLSDSNRPRDEFGLRINPWMQMDKWDWRWTTKNRYLDQCWPRWARVITWNSTNFYSLAITKIHLFIDIKWKIDIGSFTTLAWTTLDSKTIEDTLKPYTIWDLAWTCKDWNLVVPEDWSYFINYYVEFFYGSTHDITQNYSNLAMLYSITEWWPYAYSYAKQIWIIDNCWGTTIQDLKKWEQLCIWCQTNHTWEDTLVSGTLIIMKLS